LAKKDSDAANLGMWVGLCSDILRRPQTFEKISQIL
jgi:hypothetical protein